MLVDWKSLIISACIAGFLIMIMETGEILCWPVDLLCLVAAGIITVHLSAGKIQDVRTAAVNGALAGLVGGFIGAILYTVRKFIEDIYIRAVAGDLVGQIYNRVGGTGSPMSPVEMGIIGFVCCLPMLMFAGLALGAIGAVFYFWLRKR